MLGREPRKLCLGTIILLVIAAVALLLAFAYASRGRQQYIVQTGTHNVTRPMDIVLMLDASGSIDKEEWATAVEFARRVATLLKEDFERKDAKLRIALGQFSTSSRINVGLTDKFDKLANLSTWECDKRWDAQCDEDAEKKRCEENPSCIVRRKGFTETGAALCGPRPTQGSRNQDSCKQGCMGELWHHNPRIPPPPSQLSCNNTLLTMPLKSVLLVTDGKPMTPDPNGKDQPLRGTIGTKDAVAASKLVKNTSWITIGPSERTTIFGIMVGTDPQPAENETLRALSSCCSVEGTRVSKWTPNEAICTDSAASTRCPYFQFAANFQDLLRNVRRIVDGLARFEDATCVVHSGYEIRLSVASWLWLLLLLVPILATILWGWLLYLCARRNAKPPVEPHLRTPLVNLDPPALAPDIVPIDLMQPTSQGPPVIPVIRIAETIDPDPRNGVTVEPAPAGDLDVTTTEDAPGSSSDKPAGDDDGCEDSGEGHRGVGSRSPGSQEPPSAVLSPQAMNPEPTPSETEWKWAPIRHSYIVGGRPVNVHYGRGLPPNAPNMARRGFEAASENDTAEAALAAASQREDSSGSLPSVQQSSGSRRASGTASESITEETFESGSQAVVEEVAELPIHQVTLLSLADSIRAARRTTIALEPVHESEASHHPSGDAEQDLEESDQSRDGVPRPSITSRSSHRPSVTSRTSHLSVSSRSFRRSSTISTISTQGAAALSRTVSVLIVEPQDLPRKWGKWHCSVCFAVLITLAILPAVLYLAFAP